MKNKHHFLKLLNGQKKISAMLDQFPVGLEDVATGKTKKKFTMNYAKFSKSGLRFIKKITDRFDQIFLQ